MKIEVKTPEDQQDTPGVLFSSLMDENGLPYKAEDGRVHLYER